MDKKYPGTLKSKFFHWNINIWPKEYFFFKFWLKAPKEFKLMTYISVDNALSHYATLLGNNCVKETNHKIILDFIVYFDMKLSTSQNGLRGVHYNLNSRYVIIYYYIL